MLRSASAFQGPGPGGQRNRACLETAGRFRLPDDAGTAKTTAMDSHGRPHAEVRVLLSGRPQGETLPFQSGFAGRGEIEYQLHLPGCEVGVRISHKKAQKTQKDFFENFVPSCG